MRGVKSPEHCNHRRPRSSAHLRQHGNDGCGKSPDAAHFPFSITNEGVEVKLLPNPLPKSFHCRHRRFCRSW
jgi:hypothetical protein